MKTLLCSVLSLFLLVSQAHAENRYGVLAGVNLAKLHASTPAGSDTSDTSTGFLGGVFAQYGISEGFYFEPQLRYNQRGGGNVNLDYLQIPLYAKYKFMTGSAFMPVVFIGPNVGFKIGSGIEGVSGSEITKAKTIDLSAEAGLGGEFALTDTMNLGVSAAYSLGLTNIVDNAAADSSTKNRGIEIYAGLSWMY